ncbi:hypothetical protein [Nocardia sp. NPDC059239]|uniref:hypothetical protein n=1 Tax=unclassified Nocardia TaxID=2637762 RepID=UPI00369B0EEB
MSSFRSTRVISFTQDISAGQKWTAFDEICGGVNGPQTNFFAISRGSSPSRVNYRFDKKELVSTSGPNDALTAVVTDVLAGDMS